MTFGRRRTSRLIGSESSGHHPLDCLAVESAEHGRLAQPLIGGQKGLAPRKVFAPLQGCGQLHCIRGLQIVTLNEFYRTAAQRVGRLDHRPVVRQCRGHLPGPPSVDGADFPGSHQPCERAGNLNRRRPPNDCCIDFVQAGNTGCDPLRDAERNQCASIPEGESPR